MFVGREQHLRDLKRLMHKKCASLVACCGRRRIGKSTLIRPSLGRTSSAAKGLVETTSGDP